MEEATPLCIFRLVSKMNELFGFRFGFESFPSNLEYSDSDSKILEAK